MTRHSLTVASLVLSLTAPMRAQSTQPSPDHPPRFQDVSVHDPSVIKADDAFYVFGSHLAAARSADLIAWTEVASRVRDGNPLIPNVLTEMKQALDWGESKTFWAGDVVQLSDKRFYFYYSVCRGDAPRAALGLAVADRVEGPYRNVDILLRSGQRSRPSEDGTPYDATVHPNAVDPDVFRDREGQWWMIYGSYSGGIFVLRLDDRTGRPLPGQGYGKKLLGGNHARIEGPSVLFHPPSGYYYLFLSFGGLDADGGYQIRVARSKSPDGPYVDPRGHDMIDAAGPRGSFFDDAAVEPYGAKLIGNFAFPPPPGAESGHAYLSPGHNTAYHDGDAGQSYVLFHTRFPGGRRGHQLRVHPLLFTSTGWPVIAPHRYAGERVAPVQPASVAGPYQFLNHGRRITKEVTASHRIELAPDGTITGAARGTWKLTGDCGAAIALDGGTYHGAFLKQWDATRQRWVITFTALSDDGLAVWGSGE